jgi:hypothetical protein
MRNRRGLLYRVVLTCVLLAHAAHASNVYDICSAPHLFPFLLENDVGAEGSKQISFTSNASSDSWTLGAWVSLSAPLDSLRDVPVVSVGPVSLRLTAPGTPFLVVNPRRLRFQMLPNIRAHCGDMDFRERHTTLQLEDAPRLCSRVPGQGCSQMSEARSVCHSSIHLAIPCRCRCRMHTLHTQPCQQ